MGPNNNEESNIPPLYHQTLIHRPEECNVMLEMLSSGGGLAVHPGIVSFVNGDRIVLLKTAKTPSIECTMWSLS